MASSHDSQSFPVPLLWLVVVLTAGAALGIGTAAALLARKDRPLPDDPDAPLFI